MAPISAFTRDPWWYPSYAPYIPSYAAKSTPFYLRDSYLSPVKRSYLWSRHPIRPFAHAYWWLIVAPNGTRDTKISDEKNQIKLRKKITKKRCEKVFTSYPKQLFDIYCLIIFFLTVRIIVHEVLFINVSHHHGLLYYSFVLSTNKINTAQILLQIFFFYKNNMIIYTRSYRFLFFIIRI